MSRSKKHIAYSLIAQHLRLHSSVVFRSVYEPKTYSNPSLYKVGGTIFAAPSNNRMPELPVGAVWSQVDEIYGRRIFAYVPDAAAPSTQLALRPANIVRDLALHNMLRDADLAYYTAHDITWAVDEASKTELERHELELAALQSLRSNANMKAPLIEWTQRPTSLSAIRAITVTASIEIDGMFFKTQRISDNPELAEADASNALRFIIAASR